MHVALGIRFYGTPHRRWIFQITPCVQLLLPHGDLFWSCPPQLRQQIQRTDLSTGEHVIERNHIAVGCSIETGHNTDSLTSAVGVLWCKQEEVCVSPKFTYVFFNDRIDNCLFCEWGVRRSASPLCLEASIILQNIDTLPVRFQVLSDNPLTICGFQIYDIHRT